MVICLDSSPHGCGWHAVQKLVDGGSIDLGNFRMIQMGTGCNAVFGIGGAVTVMCREVELSAERLFLFGASRFPETLKRLLDEGAAA